MITQNKNNVATKVQKFVNSIRNHKDVIRIKVTGRETVITYLDWNDYPSIKNKVRKVHPDE